MAYTRSDLWKIFTLVTVGVSLAPSRLVVNGEVVFVVEIGCLDCCLTISDPQLCLLGGSLGERAGQHRQKSGGGEERFGEGEHGVRREYSICEVNEGEGSVWG
jgi:hypothetical protein